MVEFKVRTRGNASPQGKPRVYFTCHPDDFQLYFDKICEDIFKTHDCAIFYTDGNIRFDDFENLNDMLDMVNFIENLSRMNLIIVPVTARLLNDPNRAISFDIPLANDRKILILPFMMEDGLYVAYSLNKGLGNKHYISPFSSDSTEISYEEKLKKHLNKVLVSDELAREIRDAFDAHIFLSYRKKDRQYVTDLMKTIHDLPGCRDVAIWYDEFLTPGEDWENNIKSKIKQVKLFILLVTPSLLEDGNFIMTKEYPYARDCGCDILPLEVEKTSRFKLRAKYKKIPASVDPTNRDDLLFAITKSLPGLLYQSKQKDARHNYLMGLAYLNGIDVEVDIQRGVKLLILAAETGSFDAMIKLQKFYRNGEYVSLDYYEALKWAKKILEYSTREFGAESSLTITCMSNLAYMYGKVGDYQRAVEIDQRIYEYRRNKDGDENPDTLLSLNNLAVAYNNNGDYKRAIELVEKAYNLRRKLLGDDHLDTLNSLINLAHTCSYLGDYEKALEHGERVYKIHLEKLGSRHPETIASQGAIATFYDRLGEYEKAFYLYEEVYNLRRSILGDEHPDTILSLDNLAIVYDNLGNYKKAIEIHKDAYRLFCRVLGEEHPLTLTVLSNMAVAYSNLKDYQKALDIHKKVYEIRLGKYGDKHLDTIFSIGNLATAYSNFKNYDKALELHKKAYDLICQILNANHPQALTFLSNIAFDYEQLGDNREALRLNGEVYSRRCTTLGEEHPDTLTSLHNLASIYYKLEDYETAIELFEKAYDLRKKRLIENHPDIASTLAYLAPAYEKLGKYEKSIEAYEELYRIYSVIYGKDHSETQSIRLNIMRLRLKIINPK